MNHSIIDTIKVKNSSTTTATNADVNTNTMVDTIKATHNSTTAQYIYHQNTTYANINMYTISQPRTPTSIMSTLVVFTKKRKVKFKDEVSIFIFL